MRVSSSIETMSTKDVEFESKTEFALFNSTRLRFLKFVSFTSGTHVVINSLLFLLPHRLLCRFIDEKGRILALGYAENR